MTIVLLEFYERRHFVKHSEAKSNCFWRVIEKGNRNIIKIHDFGNFEKMKCV